MGPDKIVALARYLPFYFAQSKDILDGLVVRFGPGFEQDGGFGGDGTAAETGAMVLIVFVLGSTWSHGVTEGGEGRPAICWICSAVVRSSPRITMLTISVSDIVLTLWIEVSSCSIQLMSAEV